MGRDGNVASNPSVSTAGMRMMNLLVGKPPQTVQELVDSTDVTRTAITEQLNELLGAGLIERKRQPPTGRGFGSPQAGCGALCPAYNRGCYGCFGPHEAPNPVSLGDRFI